MPINPDENDEEMEERENAESRIAAGLYKKKGAAETESKETRKVSRQQQKTLDAYLKQREKIRMSGGGSDVIGDKATASFDAFVRSMKDLLSPLYEEDNRSYGNEAPTELKVIQQNRFRQMEIQTICQDLEEAVKYYTQALSRHEKDMKLTEGVNLGDVSEEEAKRHPERFLPENKEGEYVRYRTLFGPKKMNPKAVKQQSEALAKVTAAKQASIRELQEQLDGVTVTLDRYRELETAYNERDEHYFNNVFGGITQQISPTKFYPRDPLSGLATSSHLGTPSKSWTFTDVVEKIDERVEKLKLEKETCEVEIEDKSLALEELPDSEDKDTKVARLNEEIDSLGQEKQSLERTITNLEDGKKSNEKLQEEFNKGNLVQLSISRDRDGNPRNKIVAGLGISMLVCKSALKLS